MIQMMMNKKTKVLLTAALFLLVLQKSLLNEEPVPNTDELMQLKFTVLQGGDPTDELPPPAAGIN